MSYVPKPPFEIYHDGHQIADANGHLCTAEDPEIAKAILAMLNAAYGEAAKPEQLDGSR